jgi:hypothetical protein
MRNAFLVGLLGCTHLCLAQTVLLPGYKFDVVATGLTRPVSVDFVGVDHVDLHRFGLEYFGGYLQFNESAAS